VGNTVEILSGRFWSNREYLFVIPLESCILYSWGLIPPLRSIERNARYGWYSEVLVTFHHPFYVLLYHTTLGCTLAVLRRLNLYNILIG